jgi:metallo-beta-lactamase family protein
MDIQFFGAAQTVTGSKHLITTDDNTRILLDCGLFQGKRSDAEQNNRHFGFDPIELDYVVLSHAHIDHSGLLPRLVREGFRGVIFATPATISLCELMLFDSAHIQKDDLRYLNERRKKRGQPLLDALYDLDDVEQTLKMMTPLEYDEELEINEHITLHFTDAGHLLGSAMVHLDIKDAQGKVKKITFTGDIGRKGDPLLNEPQLFRQPDIIISESTYGGRKHPETESTEEDLLKIVKETCVENLGKLIIPAFSLDRTQELVYALEKMFNSKKLPNIPIYVDSPLSVKATDVMRKHEECYNEKFVRYMHQHDPNPFDFKNLKYITLLDDSKAINDSKKPCIIISASGMAEAGRVKHHIKNNIENPQCTILLVGYCTPESLGGRLKAGLKQVRIFGDEYQVKARVLSLEYYSSHADEDEIVEFIMTTNPKKVEKVFLVHGEPDASDAIKIRLQHEGFDHIIIPKYLSKHEI